MLGVATVGNATLIAIDGKPVLATDPWFGDEDEAYFGSWTLSYQIPSKHKQLIENAEYHWYSHGHPDHLNPHSIKRFRKNRVLLPDHVGGRIKTSLEARGLQVSILPERTWCTLSTNIRVMSISDYIQDAILLVDVNGRLFVNINDAGIRACRNFLRNLVAQYKESYALKLSGYGDADMINIFGEEGHRIEPRAAKKASVGLRLTALAEELGSTHVIPFSSFHRYQREDSIWAEQYTTPISAYSAGFNHSKAQYVPPFVFVDCGSGEIIELNPPKCPKSIKAPEDYGDDWNEKLDVDDKKLIRDYINKKQALRKWYGFINFKVGGSVYSLKMNGPKQKGITFEVPRNSLMLAVKYEIFDDLLIGNFMKTTFHNIHSLYEPNFAYYVGKFADNGLAQTEEEVKKYLREYYLRSKGEWLRHLFEEKAVQIFRRYVNPHTQAFQFGQKIYRSLKTI